MKYLPVFLGLAASLVAGCAGIERSRETGNPATPARTLAEQVCSNCHGVTGNAVSPNFPNLAAQQPEYFTAQLKGFRAHSRSDPAGFEYMWGLSRGLTDAQIEGLAAYFAGQKPVARTPSDPVRAAAGEAVFTRGVPERNVPACNTCHGDRGQGNGIFPRLAGQHADYLVKQLEVFQRTDERLERPEGSVMKVVAHGLSPEQMLAVAAYAEAMRSK